MDIQILKVESPGAFRAREIPGPRMSSSMQQFQRMDQEIQNYCNESQYVDIHVMSPQKGQMYLVKRRDEHESHWYRCMVQIILQTANGAKASCHLVDRAETILALNSQLREIPDKFRTVPFQVQDFTLYGIQAITMSVSFIDGADMKPTSKWDTAAIEYFEKLIKGKTMQCQVKHISPDHVKHVTLFVKHQGELLNVNDILVRKQFAQRVSEKPTRNELSPLRDESNQEYEKKEETASRNISSVPTKASPRVRTPSLSPLPQSPSAVPYSESPSVKGVGTLTPPQQVSPQGSNHQTVPRMPFQIPPRITSPQLRTTSPQSSPQPQACSEGMLQNPTSQPTSPASMLQLLQARLSSTSRDKITVEDGDSERKQSQNMSPTKVDSFSETEDTSPSSVSTKATKNKSYVPASSVATSPQGEEVITPERGLSKPSLSPMEKLMHLQQSLGQRSDGGGGNILGIPSLSSLGISKTGKISDTKADSHTGKIDGNTSDSSLGQTHSNVAISGSEEGYSSQDDSAQQANQSTSDRASQQRTPFLLSTTKVQASLSKQLLSIKEKHLAATTPASVLRKVLIHGERPPKFILDLNSSPFPEKLKQSVSQLGYPRVTLIQSACWPAISRGRDIMAVAPKDQNVTLAYLVPVLSELMQSSYTELPAGHGPTFLVVTSVWQKALSIFQQCLCLNGNNTNDRLKAILLHRGGSEEEQKVQLINGAAIVIGTLPSVLRLVESNHVNLNRLFHLVIDDADNVFGNHLEATKEFMVKFRNILRITPKRNSLRQLMVFSNKWTPAMGSYMRTYLTDPLVIITDSLEMAVYSRVHQNAVLIHPSKRVNVLLEKLTSGLNEAGKVMVFTSTKETARDLRKILKCSSCFTLLAAGEMLVHQLEDLRYEWQTGHRSDSHPVLIVSDDCVEDLELQDASCIIHYDLPPSKVKYGKRMGCLKDTFLSQIEESKTANCQVITLVTPDNMHHLHSLLQIMERSGQSPPDGITLKKASQYREKRHSTRPLCHSIKSFGFCQQETSCTARHVISPNEDQTGLNPNYMNLPQRGQVKILIMHIVDAITFYARIMRYQPSVKEGIVPVSQLGGHPQLNVQLSLWFSDPEKCTGVLQPVVGKLYAMRDNKKTIHRVLFEKWVQKKDEEDGGKLVQVKFVDEGKTENLQSHKLWTLPKAFRDIPFQAVEIISCGAMPPDKETQWTTQANLMIHNLIHGEELEGKVVLSLGNTLWLDPVVQRIKVPDLKTLINRCNVRLELIERDFAVPNPTHLEKIKELCAGKINLNTDENFQKKKDEAKMSSLKPQYETLVVGKSYQVYLSAAGSPHQFSVQKIENSDRLEKLTAEINGDTLVEDQTEPEEEKDWKVGDLCLAKFPPDDRWYRGKVAELGENLEIVFIDHGDQESVSPADIRPLPRHLLQMPFAAIDCTINHVTPLDGGDTWSPDAADELWSMCNEGAIKKTVTIHVISEEDNEDVGGGDKRYNVEMFLFLEGKKVALSHALAKEGLVVLCRKTLSEILIPSLHPENKEDKPSTLMKIISKKCQQIFLSQDVDKISLYSQELYQQILESKMSPDVSHDIVRSLCTLLNHHEALPDKSRVLITEGLLSVVDTDWSNTLLVAEEGCIPSLCMTLQQIVDKDTRESIFRLFNAFSTKKLLSFGNFINVLFGIFISVPSPEIQICCLQLLLKLWKREDIKAALPVSELVRAICNILWGNPDDVLVSEAVTMLKYLTVEEEAVAVMKKEKLGNCLECLLMNENIGVDSEAYRLVMSLSDMFDPVSDVNLYDSSESDGFEVAGVIPFINSKKREESNDDEDEGTSVDGPLPPTPPKDEVRNEREDEAHVEVDEKPVEEECEPPLLLDDDVEVFHPSVHWYQRSNSVSISVQLRGVQSYILEVTSVTVNFSAFHDDRQYVFDLTLCHRVDPDNYTSKNLGSEVLITLYKEGVGVNWPRLTGSKVKLPFLSIDCERWKEEDDYGYDTDVTSLTESKGDKTLWKDVKNATVPELDESSNSSSSSSSDEDRSSWSDSSSSGMGLERDFSRYDKHHSDESDHL